MSKSSANEKSKNAPANAGHHFADQVAGLHMTGLTGLAKLFLPHGMWKGKGGTSFQSATKNGADHEIHLTFDDGPNPATTPHLLDLFDEEGVKATFFVIGNQVEKHEDLLLEMSKRGHAIGNHTYSHAFLPMLSSKKQEKEILTTNQRIKDITGETPVLFRPPFGIVDAKAHRLLQEQGMNTVYWSAFSEDWRPIGERSVVARLFKHATPGGIMIMHEQELTGKQTIAAARSLIRKLKSKNFRFSAVSP